MQNADMIVFWAADPESTSGIYGAAEGTVRREWIKKLNMPVVHIDPYLNSTAAFMGGRWIAPRPGTDTAMALAIAYTWMKEGTYDKEYVATRTKGFAVWDIQKPYAGINYKNGNTGGFFRIDGIMVLSKSLGLLP